MIKWLLQFCSSIMVFASMLAEAKEIEDPALEVQEEHLAHECGVALVRLRKPLSYYAERYSDPAWGVKKLLFLMERQRNRGQDGAGITTVKFDMPSGQEYLHQLRTLSGVDSIFEQVSADLSHINIASGVPIDEIDIKHRSSFVGESLLGHLRYATFSGVQLANCQPFVRSHGIASRHFALAGNFNMTNTAELFCQLEDVGIFPTSDSDTQAILHMIAYHLDKEYEAAEKQMLLAGTLPSSGRDRAHCISQQMDLARVLHQAAMNWDGGYVFCGILGSGDAFACRDPAGIRPGFYFINDEVVAVASEKSALIDVFDLQAEQVLPLKPGCILTVKRNGEIKESPFKEPLPQRECTFERIYFSKANDPEIYEERKALGRQLAPRILEALQGDLEHTIFTYVPNSSQAAFQGIMEEITHQARQRALQKIKLNLEKGPLDIEQIEKLASWQPRSEMLIAKNQKLRTFISSDAIRKNLVVQLYEVTKGIVTPETTLVVVDDSIVRGITLKETLIKKLIGLHPKKIIVVSSAPPILYPDCYGIDMSQIGRFVAFQACVALLKERGQSDTLEKVKQQCSKQANLSPSQLNNELKVIYDRFTLEEISNKVAELVNPSDLHWDGSLQVIYQSLEGLRKAIPRFSGDWYFSGNYPTPGGYKVLNDSFLKWYEGGDSRVY